MLPALLLRRITAEDVGALATVDQRCLLSSAAWSSRDFAGFFAEPHHGGFLAQYHEQVIGFVLYRAERRQRRLYLVRLAVLPGWRRRQVGSRLVQRLCWWLRPVPDVRLTALVHERALSLQCFLRANGFRVVRICKGHFDAGASDGYLFELGDDQPAPVASTSGRIA